MDGNKKRILSIIIATRNRSEALGNTLECICQQVVASGAGDSVSVCVSDNCSSDDTWPTIQSAVRLYPFVRSCRQGENIGAFKNYAAATSLDDSEWVWLFGDDDILLPGALVHVLARLRDMRRDDTLVLCDYVYFYDREGSYFRRTDVVMPSTDNVYEPCSDLFHGETLQGAGMLSRIIVRRVFVAERLSSTPEKDWRSWRQIDVLVDAAMAGRQHVLCRTCVAQRIFRAANPNWTATSLYVRAFEIPVLIVRLRRRGFLVKRRNLAGIMTVGVWNLWRLLLIDDSLVTARGRQLVPAAARLYGLPTFVVELLRCRPLWVWGGKFLGRWAIPKDAIGGEMELQISEFVSTANYEA